MDKMYDIKRHNSSCLAKRIVALCRDLSFGIITEQTFYDVIDEYIKKYPDLLFDGEKIKITVLNVIGKSRSNVIIKRRDIILKEILQQNELDGSGNGLNQVDNIDSMSDSDDFVRKVMNRIDILKNILHKY